MTSSNAIIDHRLVSIASAPNSQSLTRPSIVCSSSIRISLTLIEMTPLLDNFKEAADAGENYDIRKIFDGTLVQAHPVDAVTLFAQLSLSLLLE